MSASDPDSGYVILILLAVSFVLWAFGLQAPTIVLVILSWLALGLWFGTDW